MPKLFCAGKSAAMGDDEWDPNINKKKAGSKKPKDKEKRNSLKKFTQSLGLPGYKKSSKDKSGPRYHEAPDYGTGTQESRSSYRDESPRYQHQQVPEAYRSDQKENKDRKRMKSDHVKESYIYAKPSATQNVQHIKVQGYEPEASAPPQLSSGSHDPGQRGYYADQDRGHGTSGLALQYPENQQRYPEETAPQIRTPTKTKTSGSKQMPKWPGRAKQQILPSHPTRINESHRASSALSATSRASSHSGSRPSSSSRQNPSMSGNHGNMESISRSSSSSSVHSQRLSRSRPSSTSSYDRQQAPGSHGNRSSHYGYLESGSSRQPRSGPSPRHGGSTDPQTGVRQWNLDEIPPSQYNQQSPGGIGDYRQMSVQGGSQVGDLGGTWSTDGNNAGQYLATARDVHVSMMSTGHGQEPDKSYRGEEGVRQKEQQVQGRARTRPRQLDDMLGTSTTGSHTSSQSTAAAIPAVKSIRNGDPHHGRGHAVRNDNSSHKSSSRAPVSKDPKPQEEKFDDRRYRDNGLDDYNERQSKRAAPKEKLQKEMIDRAPVSDDNNRNPQRRTRQLWEDKRQETENAGLASDSDNFNLKPQKTTSKHREEELQATGHAGLGTDSDNFNLRPQKAAPKLWEEEVQETKHAGLASDSDNFNLKPQKTTSKHREEELQATGHAGLGTDSDNFNLRPQKATPKRWEDEHQEERSIEERGMESKRMTTAPPKKPMEDDEEDIAEDFNLRPVEKKSGPKKTSRSDDIEYQEEKWADISGEEKTAALDERHAKVREEWEKEAAARLNKKVKEAERDFVYGGENAGGGIVGSHHRDSHPKPATRRTSKPVAEGSEEVKATYGTLLHEALLEAEIYPGISGRKLRDLLLTKIQKYLEKEERKLPVGLSRERLWLAQDRLAFFTNHDLEVIADGLIMDNNVTMTTYRMMKHMLGD